MKITYINPTFDPEIPEITLNNIEKIETERSNNFDVEHDIISCYKKEDNCTKIIELDLLGDARIIIERDQT